METIKSLWLLTIAAVIGLLHAASAASHHSSQGVYDGDTLTEVRGVVVDMDWRNPHVRLVIRADNDDGTSVVWQAEGASVSVLGRKGIASDSLSVGDRIRIAGNPAIRDAKEMYFTNVLLPDGREVLTLPRATPRWSGDALGFLEWSELPAADVEQAKRVARGIFRVWTSDFSSPSRRLWNDAYPLTAAAAAARASWDPVNSPYVSCIKGMPSIMEQPYPMEFVDGGDEIVLNLEEYDVARRIVMRPDAVPGDLAPAPWGHSIGRFEGPTLVVTTTGISWPYFDQTGIPLNETSVLVERFTPREDGSRLDYSLTVTDPVIFTEQVVLQRDWVWRPGERLKPFDCRPQR